MRNSDHRAMLSPQLSEAVVIAARHGGISPAEFVRDAVRQALVDLTLRGSGYCALSDLTQLFSRATGWLDLQARLRHRGLVLRKTDEGVHLHSWPQDHALLPLATLGPTEAALTLRFRAPFPAPLAFAGQAGHRRQGQQTKEPGGASHHPALPAPRAIAMKTAPATAPATAYRSTIPAGQLIS